MSEQNTAPKALIYEAMVKVMQEVSHIEKTKRNNEQNFMYRGIDDAYNALHPVLKKYGVISVPSVLEITREEKTSRKGNVLTYSVLKVKYTFYAADGSFIEGVVIGEGMDSGDKSTNKAMSVAHKNALLQTFCIPTAELQEPDTGLVDEGYDNLPVLNPEHPKWDTAILNLQKKLIDMDWIRNNYQISPDHEMMLSEAAYA